MAGIVPDAVLKRRSRAAYDTAFLRSLKPLAQTLLPHIACLELVRRGYVEPADIGHCPERLVHGLECNEGQLRRVLLLEHWLLGNPNGRAAWPLEPPGESAFNL
jgi:hypothetical protein